MEGTELTEIRAPKHSPKEPQTFSGLKQFGIRAFKTFVQGSTGALIAGGLLERLSVSVLESAAIGGLAALISFLNNWSAAAEQPKPTEKA